MNNNYYELFNEDGESYQSANLKLFSSQLEYLSLAAPAIFDKQLILILVPIHPFSEVKETHAFKLQPFLRL